MKSQLSSDFAKLSAPFMIYFMPMTSMAMVSPFIGIYALSGGASPILVGYIYAAFFGVSLFLRLPLTWLARRYGRRASILFGFSLMAGSLLIFTVSGDPIVLLVGNGLRGMGFSVFHPSIISLSVDVQTSRMKKEQAVGYILIAPPAGHTLGPPLGGLLLTSWGYGALFSFSSALNLVGMLVTLLTVTGGVGGGEIGGQEAFSRARVKKVFGPQFTLTMYSRTTISYVLETVTAYLPIYAIKVIGMSALEVSLLFSLAAVFNVASRPLSGILASRGGERKVLGVGCGLSGATCALLALVASPLGVWAGMPPYGYGVGSAVPSSYSYVAKSLKKEVRALGVAILTLAVDLGHSLGSVSSAELLSLGGFSLLFLGAFIVAGSGAVVQLVSLRMIPSEKTHEDTAT